MYSFNYGVSLKMPIKGDNFLNKLILLFVFDKMEIPLSDSTIADICCQSNEWLNYMDCQTTLSLLKDNGFVNVKNTSSAAFYSLTPNGRNCLSNFYLEIPYSLRDSISKFAKQNQNRFRRKQEYIADYHMNKDGTYSVLLRISEDSVGIQFELKLNVPSRQIAKNIYTKWPDKAEHFYATVYENLVD